MSEPKSKRPLAGPVAEPARLVEAPPSPEVQPISVAPDARPQQALPAPRIPLAAAPDPLAVFGAAQAALAQGAGALADEMTGLVQTGFANAAETASALLGARTLNDAIEVNAGFFRKSFATLLDGSVRLTDIGARLTAEALRPLMSGGAR